MKPIKIMNKLLKENDDSYLKGVEILDKAFGDKETEDLWNKAFKKLVPKTGNAKTDIGEIIRCLSSLSHAYYQNGDIMSHLQYQPGYRQDASDLSRAVRNLGDDTLNELIDKMWSTRVESAYAKYMANFYTYFMNNYIKNDKLAEDNIIPLDKEKYLVLMSAVDELIASVNGNREQLKSVKQEVDEMFDRAINS